MIKDRWVGYIAHPVASTHPRIQPQVLLSYDDTGPAVNSSVNVSSVTNNADAGDITINFGVGLSVSGGTSEPIAVATSLEGTYVGGYGALSATAMSFQTKTDAGAVSSQGNNYYVIYGPVGAG